jgi:PAS domain S-box-containing protein
VPARAVAGPAHWVRVATEAVVAADEANRIVAVSPAGARLLGWDAADLVGQRLTVIIPEPLREQHLAGFSRHRLTGEARIIGRSVELPALRRDGTTVPARLRRATHATPAATWYLGWLEDPARAGS